MREISHTSTESSLPLAAIGPVTPSELPTSVPLILRERPEPGALIGRLEIPGVGVESLVAAGTEALTLRRGVGHVNGTALPGEPGNVGLAGHRDTVFRGLRNLQTSDRIFLRTAEGSFEYSIESFRTVTPDQVEVLDASPYPTLTLITCFPFDFVGPAPMRYIVRARQVDHTVSAP
jgi:sortase A